MEAVFIVSAVRTPIGSFGGVLSGIPATQLGSIAIKGALKKAGVAPDLVEEVYFGNVVSANLGQAPARQAALGAGIPYSTPCTTINKVCASGMKSVMLGAQSIMLGLADVVVAGGMENMSQIPFYLPNMRFGQKYGHAEVLDGLQRDGLTDVYEKIPMGICADRTAQRFDITREAQDAFAMRSYTLAADATAKGAFEDEIISVEIPQRKGEPLLVREDEEFRKVDFSKIPSLRPAFSSEGTVTAANASTINDGASALVLVSERKLKELGLTPVARIMGFADAEQEPAWFTLSPTLAAPKAAKMAGISLNDVDYFEVNEAFAVVAMAFGQVLDLDMEKINVHGGAVALGHPLGASGARILTTLNGVLHQHAGKIGLATICNGGGGASALVLESL